jgi:hypothetical protein
MKTTVAVLSLFGLLLAGCRHAPAPAENTGHSSFAFVDQPVGPPPVSSGEPIQPSSRSQWREATVKDPVVMPVYPKPALKAKTGRSTVGVHIVVDGKGRVAEIRPSMLVFNTPGPFADDFREAVELALHQWQFTPARAEYYEIVHDGDATFNRVTRTENVETEFDLAFTFTEDGKVEQGTGK